MNLRVRSRATGHEARIGGGRVEMGLAKTGIDVLGDIPWGTHFCHFYETKQDLLDILITFFRAGLEGNELCVCLVAEPFTAEEARDALRRGIPEAERHLSEG